VHSLAYRTTDPTLHRHQRRYLTWATRQVCVGRDALVVDTVIIDRIILCLLALLVVFEASKSAESRDGSEQKAHPKGSPVRSDVPVSFEPLRLLSVCVRFTRSQDGERWSGRRCRSARSLRSAHFRGKISCRGTRWHPHERAMTSHLDIALAALRRVVISRVSE
jgi:hypothetical protein